MSNFRTPNLQGHAGYDRSEEQSSEHPPPPGCDHSDPPPSINVRQSLSASACTRTGTVESDWIVIEKKQSKHARPSTPHSSSVPTSDFVDEDVELNCDLDLSKPQFFSSSSCRSNKKETRRREWKKIQSKFGKNDVRPDARSRRRQVNPPTPSQPLTNLNIPESISEQDEVSAWSVSTPDTPWERRRLVDLFDTGTEATAEETVEVETVDFCDEFEDSSLPGPGAYEPPSSASSPGEQAPPSSPDLSPPPPFYPS